MDIIESSVRPKRHGAVRCQALEEGMEVNVYKRERGHLGRHGNLATSNKA
jgi:hypothetical protein